MIERLINKVNNGKPYTLPASNINYNFMARKTPSKSNLYKRYLASVFVNAKHITPNAEHITTLLSKLDGFDLLPNVIYEEVKGVRNPRIGFTSLDNRLQIALGSVRFDIVRQSPEQQNEDLGSFSEFCDRSAKVFTIIFDYFKGLRGHRLAAVSERILDDIIEQPSEVKKNLFILPEFYKNNQETEFDWRLVSRVNQKFGEFSEDCNFIASFVKRQVVLIKVSQNKAEQSDANEETSFTIDINTVPDNQFARFGNEEIKSYFNSVSSWQRNLNQEFLTLLEGKNVTGNGDSTE